MKKLLVSILSFMLLFNLSVHASTNSTAKQAADELGDYGIMHIEETGEFRLESSVSRAVFVKTLLKTMNEPLGESTSDIFTDISDDYWAKTYISRAADIGIINGMGDGLFLPDSAATYSQAVKMIVCALGYEEQAIRQGGYPNGYIMTATRLKITDSISFMPDAEISQGDMAIMLKNALDVPFMTYKDTDEAREYIVLDGKNSVELKTLRTLLESN